MKSIFFISSRGRKSHNVVRALKILVLVVCCTAGRAQDRCGTVQYIKNLQEKNLIRENDKKFEQWISRKKQAIGARTNALTTFRIPVVIHVIHNGEAIGTGLNISDAQIASQIKVLNNDFKRLNADTTNTPAEFSSLAGKINFEFVLAKQSPQGTETTGIVRVRGTKNQWSLDDNNVLKALSYWPAEDYFNIWVTDLTSTLLGYAQFPVSDLAGLEDAEDNRLTDGVVLDYRIVGSNEDGSFNLTTTFNRGRTATHEVGHFFGLRHIWGDDEGACFGAGDYVDDTPNQGNSSSGCPAHPQLSCSARIMFQNYMDYTNDACMNLYTKQQVERMLTVIENSPRRESLLSSDGLYDPAPVKNDMAITKILDPSSQTCAGWVVPKIVVKNVGINTVTSAKIQFTKGNTIIETMAMSFQQLEPQDEFQISCAPVLLTAGTSGFKFEITEINGDADGKPNDNRRAIQVEVPDKIETPFSETFDDLPDAWKIINPDEDDVLTKRWAVTQAGVVNGQSNQALYIGYFEGLTDDKEEDIIVTPVIELSGAVSPFLAFDVAYGKFQNYSDGLEVYAILECSGDYAKGEKIYSKFGSQLATVSKTTGEFTPLNENQWRREVVDLKKFAGAPRVQFVFVGVSDNGNNLYLDNIAVRTDVSENIAIEEIVHPSPVHCSNEIQPSVLLTNKGQLPIESFSIVYAVNNGSSESASFSEGIDLQSGEKITVELPTLTLNDGVNSLSLTVINPNGFSDIDPADNSLRSTSFVNHAEDKIPLRKNFDEEASVDPWVISNPSGTVNWRTTATNYGQSLYFKKDETGSDEETSWFVSPVLNFADVATASLFFDVFTGKVGDSIKDREDDFFQVLLSRDCGNTFDEILFSARTPISKNGELIPTADKDWENQYINLNTLSGEGSARIAFVVSNAFSGTLYLDNIEFFVSDNPAPFATTDLYSLYPTKVEHEKSFNMTFNLSSRQPVAYELIDMMGKQVGSKELTDVLNQTYTVDIENAASGMYLVRLLIDKKYYVSRIVVTQ